MKKSLLLILSLIAFQSYGQFITTWKTDNPGTSTNTKITIPTFGGGYNYDIYWEKVDNTSYNGTKTNVLGEIILDFDSVGTYRVSITGSFPRIYFNSTDDESKILTIEQWGNNPWTSMQHAFYGCNNLVITAVDTPDLSIVTDMSRMFNSATSLNQEDLSSWNVENVMDMSYMFFNATAFNGNLSTWNVGNVTDMSYMFHGTSFNQDISSWNVGNVMDMSYMFQYVTLFNGDLSSWDVSNVTNMEAIFSTTSFNQDLSTWNVSKVINMSGMFFNITVFNQDFSTWDVSNVMNMGAMFTGAVSFNQNLSTWNVSSVTNMFNMFSNSGLSTVNYDLTLQGWAAQNVQLDVPFRASGLTYCAGETARATLADKGWIIDQDALDCTQTITFEALADKTMGDADFDLTATTNCNLAVSYASSDETVATISGSTGTVTIVGAGTTTITASQSGDANYDAATAVPQPLTVNVGDQTIIFEALATKTFGDGDFDLTATASSGLAVSYSSSDETVATISGSKVTIVGVGTTTITASQPGNDNYNAATTDVGQELTVNRADQTIIFDALADKVTTDADFDLTATGGASGNAITFTSADETVAKIAGNTVTIMGEGTTIITASQTGDDNYNAATDVTQTLTVNEVRETQTITFAAIADQILEAGTLTLGATASSGLEVSYEIVSGPATVTDKVVTFTDLGIVTVSASQAGSDAFFAATDVQQSFEVITVTGVEKDLTTTISFYPNPANNYITIRSKDQLVQVEVLEMSGKQMMIENNVQLDISKLKAGNYLLKVTTASEVSVHQFIKK